MFPTPMGRPSGWLVLASLAACAHLPPPAPRTLLLGGLTAEYRDPSEAQTALCEAPPADLTREVKGMNRLLAEYLQGTSADADGMWGDAHVELLAAGEKALPRAVAAYADELKVLTQCPFRIEDRGGGEEFARQAQRRLATSAALLEEVRARRALAQWRRQLSAVREAAKAERCAAPSKKPVAFFAAEDEEGQVAWWFCDGAQVVQARGASPAFTAAAPEQERRKSAYLGAAKRHPPSTIHRPPRVPSHQKPKDEAFDLNAPVD